MLRQHRPAYTPRTGFVWPIREAATADDSKKRDAVDTPLESQEGEGSLPAIQPKKKIQVTAGGVKKRQNIMLLANAMRTTAIHASQSFTLPTAVSQESNVPDTPLSASAPRSSATPAPAAQVNATPRLPGPSTSQDIISGKSSSGTGKKKKKRKDSAEDGQVQAEEDDADAGEKKKKRKKHADADDSAEAPKKKKKKDKKKSED